MITVSLQAWHIVVIAIVYTLIAPILATLPPVLQSLYLPVKSGHAYGGSHIWFLIGYNRALPISVMIGIVCIVGSSMAGLSYPSMAYFIGPFLLSISGLVLVIVSLVIQGYNKIKYLF